MKREGETPTIRILFQQPIVNGLLLESAKRTTILFRYVCRRGGVQDNLQETLLIASGNTLVRVHAEIQVFKLPQLVHEPNKLESQLILAEVVPGLEHDKDRVSTRICILENQPQGNLLPRDTNVSDGDTHNTRWDTRPNQM